MSIEQEITRINNNISDAFSAVEEQGGTVEDGANSDDLAQSILNIPASSVEIVQETGDSETAVMSQKVVTKELNQLSQELDGKQPKGNYLIEVPAGYVTETELESKGYAKQSDVNNLSEEIVDLGNTKANANDLNTLLPKNQGAGNVGKILVVGTDGNLTLAPMPEGGATGDVVGVLDESNNILLSGNIADGTYTLKWLLDDGTYADAGTLDVSAIVTYTITQSLTNVISNNSTAEVRKGESFTTTLTASSGYNMGAIVVTMGGSDITSSAVSGNTINITSVTGNIVITATATKPNYTNQIPISVDTDGSIYNGKGYKEKTRFNSSGTIKDLTTGTNPAWTTGFIPVTMGSVIRLKDCWIDADATSAVYGENYGALYCYAYDGSKTKLSGITWVRGVEDNTVGIKDVVVDDNGNAVQFTWNLASTAFVRFTLGGDPTKAILTVNEEIK